MINCFVNILLFLYITNPPIELQICLMDNNGIEHPWIFGYDIKTYDWDNHIVYVIPDSVKAVVSRSISCSGFSVKIGDTTLYRGMCDLVYDSFINHESPTIFVWKDSIPSINLECGCFKIQYFGENEDKRQNALLYTYLKKENKLAEKP